MLTLATLFMAFAVIAGFFTVFAYINDAGKRRLAKRAKCLVANERGTRKTQSGGQLRQTPGVLDDYVQRIMRRPDALRARLACAGMSPSIGRYGMICVVVAFAAMILAMTRGLAPILAVLAGLSAGWMLPYVYVNMRIGKRRAQFFKLFPEAISLIVRGLKAGLPFADTLVVVGREVSNPVGEEFRRMCDQLKLGQPIEEAMLTVARRIELPEFNFLITTLSVQRETGGNLAATLENLEEMLRKRQQIRMKVKAMSSEAKASAGIIGSLPFVMSAILYVVSHDYIMRLFTTHAGHFMLGVSSCSLIAGVYMMTRMVRFDL